MLTIWLHGLWLAVLVPALLLGGHLAGISGVAAAQAAVVVGFLTPLLAIMLRRSGVHVRALVKYSVRPVVGIIPILLVAAVVSNFGWPPVAVVLAGGSVGGLIYLAVVWPMRQSALSLWRMSR